MDTALKSEFAQDAKGSFCATIGFKKPSSLAFQLLCGIPGPFIIFPNEADLEVLTGLDTGHTSSQFLVPVGTSGLGVNCSYRQFIPHGIGSRRQL
jgi:hypothetical protein